MVKFLLEHGLALEEKEDDSGNSPMDTGNSPMYGNLQYERGRVTHGIIMELQNGDYQSEN